MVPNPFYAKFDDDFWLSWAHIAFLSDIQPKKTSIKLRPSSIRTVGKVLD